VQLLGFRPRFWQGRSILLSKQSKHLSKSSKHFRKRPNVLWAAPTRAPKRALFSSNLSRKMQSHP
jgi:hypothetical protein